MTAVQVVPTLLALGEWLADEGLACYDGHGAGPTVMYGKGFDNPDDAVILNIYDDVRIEDAWNPDLYIQFRYRTAAEDSLAIHEVADRFYQRLDFQHSHQLSRLILPGGVTVQWAERRVTTDATPDDAGRWTRADSYRLTLNPS